MGKRLGKMDPTGETYLEDWKPNTRGYNTAKIEMNGHIFDLYYNPPLYGYSGFYGATKDGKQACGCREFTKLGPLLRELHYRYPKAGEMTEKPKQKIDAIAELFQNREAAKLIWYSVCMRKNILDTGSPHISAEDARQNPKIYPGALKALGRLTDEQLALSNKLEAIKAILFNSF